MFKKSLDSQTLSAKAGQTALKALATAGNMLAMWAVGEIITGLVELSQVSKEVAQKADELGNSFNNTKSDIEGYQTKISELYQTINDSSSSVEEVTTARRNLMTVQDELIEKFGNEKETIELITGAINGQTDALDKLTEKQWQASKNKFNDGGVWNNVSNFLNGYSDNIDRMLGEYEDYSVEIDLSKFSGFWGNKNYQEFQKVLSDDFGAVFTLDNDNYTQSFNKINAAYKTYEVAFASGDKEKIDRAIENYATTVATAMDNALRNSDTSVISYFEGMYPALQSIVDKWNFKTRDINLGMFNEHNGRLEYLLFQHGMIWANQKYNYFSNKLDKQV